MRAARFVVPTFAVALLLGSIAQATPIRWSRDPSDPARASGLVDLAEAPDTVWARMKDVEHWPGLFSDVRALKVKSHEGRRWVLRLDTVAMDCGPHDYTVEVQENRTIAIDIDAPGLVASAILSVTPRAEGGSVGRYEITVRVARVLSWFISEQGLRKKQERMLISYLEDLARTFGGARLQVSP